MRRPGQIGAVAAIRARRTNAMNGIGDCHIPGTGKILQPVSEATPPSADGGAHENYCCRDCNCTGARACTLACVAGAGDAGLRAGAATGRGGLADVAADRAADIAADAAADVLGRRFCSDTLAITRAICSWFALS